MTVAFNNLFDPFYDLYSIRSRNFEIPAHFEVFKPENSDDLQCLYVISPSRKLGATNWTKNSKWLTIGVFRDEGREPARREPVQGSWIRSGVNLTFTSSIKHELLTGEKVDLFNINVSTITNIAITVVSDYIFKVRVPFEGPTAGNTGFYQPPIQNFFEENIVFRMLPSLELVPISKLLEIFQSTAPLENSEVRSIYNISTDSTSQLPSKSFSYNKTVEGLRNFNQEFDSLGNALSLNYQTNGELSPAKTVFSKYQNNEILNSSAVKLEALYNDDTSRDDKVYVYDFYGLEINDKERGPYFAEDLITRNSNGSIKRKISNGKALITSKLYDKFFNLAIGINANNTLVVRAQVNPIKLDQVGKPVNQSFSKGTKSYYKKSLGKTFIETPKLIPVFSKSGRFKTVLIEIEISQIFITGRFIKAFVETGSYIYPTGNFNHVYVDVQDTGLSPFAVVNVATLFTGTFRQVLVDVFNYTGSVDPVTDTPIALTGNFKQVLVDLVSLELSAFISSASTITAKLNAGAYILILGQSNIANYGEPTDSYISNTNVLRLNADGIWEPTNSPASSRHLASGVNANIDGRIGDGLISNFGQVNIVNIAVGGTKLGWWASDAATTDYAKRTDDIFTYTNSKLYERVVYAAAIASNKNFKYTHVLMDIGESDALDNTSQIQFQTAFLKVQSDLVALGITAPIFLARASYVNKVFQQIVDAQQYLIQNTTNVYCGPNTDNYTNLRWDTFHFNKDGLNQVAAEWVTRIKDRSYFIIPNVTKANLSQAYTSIVPIQGLEKNTAYIATGTGLTINVGSQITTNGVSTATFTSDNAGNIFVPLIMTSNAALGKSSVGTLTVAGKTESWAITTKSSNVTINYPSSAQLNSPFNWTITNGQPNTTWSAYIPWLGTTTQIFTLDANGAGSYTGTTCTQVGTQNIVFTFNEITDRSTDKIIKNVTLRCYDLKINYPATTQVNVSYNWSITNGPPNGTWTAYIPWLGVTTEVFTLDASGNGTYTNSTCTKAGTQNIAFTFSDGITRNISMLCYSNAIINYPSSVQVNTPYNWSITNGPPNGTWTAYIPWLGTTTQPFTLDANGNGTYTGSTCTQVGTQSIVFTFSDSTTRTVSLSCYSNVTINYPSSAQLNSPYNWSITNGPPNGTWTAYIPWLGTTTQLFALDANGAGSYTGTTCTKVGTQNIVFTFSDGVTRTKTLLCSANPSVNYPSSAFINAPYNWSISNGAPNGTVSVYLPWNNTTLNLTLDANGAGNYTGAICTQVGNYNLTFNFGDGNIRTVSFTCNL